MAVRTTTEQKLPLTLAAVKETAMTSLGVQTSSYHECLMLSFFLFLTYLYFYFHLTLQYDNETTPLPLR